MSGTTFSNAFQRLYCDPAVFGSFSARHPVSLKRALPFQPQDPIVDDPHLLDAEFVHLADKDDNTRLTVIDAYARCGLLPEADAVNLKSVIDFFGSEFFDLMGLVYANAGMYICALRWYREYIVKIETREHVYAAPFRGGSGEQGDPESVYASVGYCLYSLGMFEEAIAWTKSCIRPHLEADTACLALIKHEAQQVGGTLWAIERATNRARYTINGPVPGNASSICDRLKIEMKKIAPFQESYFGWVSNAAPSLPIQEGYPFFLERGTTHFLRHKMNLLFYLCGAADAFSANSSFTEARQLLSEAATLEPNAHFIQERIQALP
jgi:hypothetical protein